MPSARRESEGKSGEALFFELAIEDLRQAADLFRPVHDATAGMDGWVSLEVSPSLAYDAASTVKEAVRLHAQAQRPNLFIKIPGTSEGQAAIEEAIFRGVPVNVTLLVLSRDSTSRQPKLTCGESSAGLPRGSIRRYIPWHRCSSAAGTKP